MTTSIPIRAGVDSQDDDNNYLYLYSKTLAKKNKQNN